MLEETSQQTRDRLIACSLLTFLSPSRIRLLVEFSDSLDVLCDHPVAALKSLLSISDAEARMLRNPLALPEIQREVSAIREQVIVLTDDDYPRLLREIFDPPLVLHVRGDRSILQRPSIAIVGSRRATPYGVNVAGKLGRELAAAGLTVVSGMARGIDAAAHRGALECGATIAVMGTGIELVYPKSHRALSAEISNRGLLLSEFPRGTPPLARNFPMRNRLISGLVSGVIIVEANDRSGSLITARMAAEQGREVFAVPGPIFSDRSEGPHRLIQYGAKLLHSIEDLFEELPDLRPALDRAGTKHEHDPILELIPREMGIHPDQLALKTGRPAGQLAETLLRFEMDGKVSALPGGMYIRKA